MQGLGYAGDKTKSKHSFCRSVLSTTVRGREDLEGKTCPQEREAITLDSECGDRGVQGAVSPWNGTRAGKIRGLPGRNEGY